MGMQGIDQDYPSETEVLSEMGIEGADTGQSQEIPMKADEPAKAAPTASPEYEITWNGKTIKAPVEKITHWASQGYDYAQKMQAWNQEREQMSQAAKQAQEVAGRYQPIDEYIKQNPQWWDHVQQQWQNREQMARAQDPSNPLLPELQNLKQEFSKTQEFINELRSEKENQRAQADDQRLNQEIEAIRKEYPDLDLSLADESGKSLEMRVYEHAIKNEIKSFKTAFRDFNHDTLMKKAEERAKESLAKDSQRKTKLGLLGSTPTPTRRTTEAQNIKNKSYGDLEREALEELGLA